MGSKSITSRDKLTKLNVSDIVSFNTADARFHLHFLIQTWEAQGPPYQII
jgi:hypothetical protein